MVRNAAVEAEKKIRTIKVTVQQARRNCHTTTFMGLLGGNLPIKMSGFGSRFQDVDNNSMSVEALRNMH